MERSTFRDILSSFLTTLFCVYVERSQTKCPAWSVFEKVGTSIAGLNRAVSTGTVLEYAHTKSVVIKGQSEM